MDLLAYSILNKKVNGLASGVKSAVANDVDKTITITFNDDSQTVLHFDNVDTICDWTTNTAVGNLPAGSNLNGKPISEVLKLITVSYVLPTATVSYSNNNSVIENGTSFNLDVTVTNLVKGTNDISKIVLYVNGTETEELTVTTAASYSFATVNNIRANTTIEVRVYDNTDKYKSYSKSYTFIYPYYWGSSDDIPTADTILLGTEMIEAKGNKKLTHNAANQYVFIAYPANYGNLTSILDSNSFEYIDSFTKIEVSVNGVNYYCYYIGKLTATGFKFTYKH